MISLKFPNVRQRDFMDIRFREPIPMTVKEGIA